MLLYERFRAPIHGGYALLLPALLHPLCITVLAGGSLSPLPLHTTAGPIQRPRRLCDNLQDPQGGEGKLGKEVVRILPTRTGGHGAVE